MNIKQMITSTIGGAWMLAALVGTAAAEYSINIYGSDTQFQYWNELIPGFVVQQGCSSVFHAKYDNKNAITKATSCYPYWYDGYYNYDTAYLRVSSTSVDLDGILAKVGDDSLAGSSEKCWVGDPGDPGAARGHYRKMVDESSCSWGTPTAPGSCTKLKCAPVNISVSDLHAESFTQYSYGRVKGPSTSAGTDPIERIFGSYSSDPYWYDRGTLVVPFGFFVNNSVTKDGSPLTNITREMAVLLYSGQVANWNEFGPSFPNLNTVLCLRHAGSGTAAALDYAVVGGRGWGGSLVGVENRPDDVANYVSSAPTIYFNDSIDDMMHCVNTLPGAIGYAVADKETSAGSGRTYANTLTLMYNGEKATADGIKNGRYDFWTHGLAYGGPYLNYYPPWYQLNNLLTYAADPTKIPASESPYWALKGQMKFRKFWDTDYPSR